MKFRFSSFLLALLLLVSAQGAFAVTYYSKSATPSLTTLAANEWDVNACGLAAATTANAVVPGATDTLVICGSTANSRNAGVITTLTGAVASVAAITIDSGASVTLSGNITAVPPITINPTGVLANGANGRTLTFTAGAGITNNGIINLTQTDGTTANAAIILSGAGTISGSGVLNSKCESVAGGGVWTTPATWGSATSSCGVTATAAFVLPSAGSDVNIDSTTTTPVTLSTPATVKSLSIEDAGKFTLSSTLTISVNYTNNSATANVGNVVLTGGTLAFTDAAHQITIATAQTYPVIDLSSFTAARIVTFSGGFATTISSLVLPTSIVAISVVAPASGAVTVTALSGNTLTSATNSVPTSGAVPLVVTAGGTGVLTTGTGTGAVSAPLFSTKEKAKVFVEEVNN